MIYDLFMWAALALPAATHPTVAPRILPAVIATELAIEEVGCFPPGDDAACELTAHTILTWMRFESVLQANPPGHNDKGGACGPMQVAWPNLKGGIAMCKRIREDLDLGVLEGARLMVDAVKRCGSVRSGLGAYSSTGKCGAVQDLVRQRCAIAGC